MDSTLYDRIRNVTAARKSRDENKNFVLAHPEYLEDLIRFSFAATDRDSHKACWILEFVAHEEVTWLQPHLDFFCSNLDVLKDESAIRPIAKICQLITVSHFKKDPEITLSQTQLQQITEACFDWLINDIKVAPKAYSIRALYILGKHFDWIHPELKIILEKEYRQQSPAYKAVAREILKKMK
jgi:hypothetical protein